MVLRLPENRGGWPEWGRFSTAIAGEEANPIVLTEVIACILFYITPR